MRSKLSISVSALFLAASVSYVPKTSAQSSQQDSVAEAARRAREQKKTAARPAPVITDDTFKSPPTTPAVQTPYGNASTTDTPTSAGRDQREATTAPKSSDLARDAAQKKAELSKLKQQVADKQKEVEIAQRELSLENEGFYSKPDFSRDKAGKSRLDSMQASLKQQQDELAALKVKLTAIATEDTDTAKSEAPKP